MSSSQVALHLLQLVALSTRLLFDFLLGEYFCSLPQQLQLARGTYARTGTALLNSNKALPQILNELFGLSLHLLSLHIDRAALLVVQLAVGPDLLQVGREGLHGSVHVARLHILADCVQIHRLLDDGRIIPQTKCLPRHWLMKRLRVAVLAELCEQNQQLVTVLTLQFKLRLLGS